MNISNVVVAICSLLFIMIGADKFFPFMEPPCTLMNSISPIIWKLLGCLTLAGGVILWFPKYRKYVAGFFICYMLFFIIVHLVHGTYDIGGAASMAVMLGLLVWNPDFIQSKKVQTNG